MKKKGKIHLVEDDKIIKRYNKLFIFTMDESVFEYDLKDWMIRRYEECIEAEKKDKTEMDEILMQHITRIRLVNTDKKSQLMMPAPSPLKPVV
jgi:hypothetical protein